MKVTDLIKFLETLKRKHTYCEDSFYSCPMEVDGCSDSTQIGCNCGAEKHNAEIDAMINHLKQFKTIK